MHGDRCERETVESLWAELAPQWRGLVDAVARTADAARAIAGVPAAWIDLLGSGQAIAVAADQWCAMPRFARYLRTSTLDVGVGTGIGGPVLAYLIADWAEQHGEVRPGLMIGGAPTPPEVLAGFEGQVGVLPAGLHAAWSAHGFMLLKSGGWLGSLIPAGASITGPPAMFPRRVRGRVGDAVGKFECLEVIDPGRSYSGCLVRPPGERAWLDHVVHGASSGEFCDSHRPTLECMFTDRSMSELDA